MEKHISLLGMLFGVCGLLGLTVAVALVALAGGAAAISSDSRTVAAGVTAVLFGVTGAVVFVWAASCLWTGRALRRLEPRGRPAGLVLAGFSLFVPPLGTALGMYGLWVLLHHESRRRLEPSR